VPLLSLIKRLLPASFKNYLLSQWPERPGSLPPWTFDADGLWTVHNTDFLREPVFAAAYEAASATNSWDGEDVRFRAYVACWAAQQARHIGGDFVECGVNRGGLAMAQMRTVGFENLDKNYWLVDTYAGFPDSQRHLVSEVQKQERYSECYQEVLQTFAPYPNARVIRGVVPEVLPQVKAEKVCYLSLDMNCAEPEIAALEWFWDKLSPGAIVLMDDYAYIGYGRQKEALDALSAQKKVPILGLPTGQGLLIKL
jgi:hypothetical protein